MVIQDKAAEHAGNRWQSRNCPLDDDKNLSCQPTVFVLRTVDFFSLSAVKFYLHPTAVTFGREMYGRGANGAGPFRRAMTWQVRNSELTQLIDLSSRCMTRHILRTAKKGLSRLSFIILTTFHLFLERKHGHVPHVITSMISCTHMDKQKQDKSKAVNDQAKLALRYSTF